MKTLPDCTRQLTLGLLLSFTSSVATAQPIDATYDYVSGRIIVHVTSVVEWYIESFDHQLTGPDDVVLAGILPTSASSFVTNNDERIGESSFGMPYTYTLDLGRVAEEDIAPGKLVLRTTYSFGDIEREWPVRSIPECDAATGVLLSFGMLIVSRWRQVVGRVKSPSRNRHYARSCG